MEGEELRMEGEELKVERSFVAGALEGKKGEEVRVVKRKKELMVDG